MVPRRPQLTQEELRGLFVDAGRQILREEGLSCGAEALTFKRVRERVEADTGILIGNGSIIGRVWESLFDYQTAVMATIAADDSTAEIERDPRRAGSDPSGCGAILAGVPMVHRSRGVSGRCGHQHGGAEPIDGLVIVDRGVGGHFGRIGAPPPSPDRGRPRAVLSGGDRADGEDLSGHLGHRRVPGALRPHHSPVHHRRCRTDRGMRAPQPCRHRPDERHHAPDGSGGRAAGRGPCSALRSRPSSRSSSSPILPGSPPPPCPR